MVLAAVGAQQIERSREVVLEHEGFCLERAPEQVLCQLVLGDAAAVGEEPKDLVRPRITKPEGELRDGHDA
jgi:hypothetical protein